MKNISKILTTSVFLSVALFANSNDENIIEFEKKRLSANPAVELDDIKINTKKELPLKGWTGYVLDVNAKIQNKPIKVKDILFFNGKYIAPDLIDIKNGKSLKDFMSPDLTSKYYDEKKLIAGNHKAKDKLVIFSDPLCPYCVTYVPQVIKYVKKHEKNIALYYYHFPLSRIHPAADIVSSLMDIAKHKGIKDLELKVYETKWDKYFDSKSTDKKVILEAFNKELKTNIKLEELTKEVDTKVKKDVTMGEDVMVQGTPTIYVNGKKDNSKLKFETLGK